MHYPILGVSQSGMENAFGSHNNRVANNGRTQVTATQLSGKIDNIAASISDYLQPKC